MSIFRRDPEPAPPKPAPPRQPAARQPAPSPRPTTEATRIAAGSKVVGEISGTADLQIDGHVEGVIRLEKQVTVGPQGRVDGPIEAGAVQVGGKVVGSVYGRERVEVQTGGSLEGDVTSPRPVISEGAAFFRGSIEMSDKPPRGGGKGAPPAKAAAAAPGKPNPGPGKPNPGSGKPPEKREPEGGGAPAGGPHQGRPNRPGGRNKAGRPGR